MKFVIAAVAAASAVVLVPALAQAADAPTGVYVTAGYANASVEDLNLGAIQGRIGYRVNNWLGVEGELMGGVKEDSLSESGVTVNFKLKHAEAAYVVGFLPVAENTDLLARVGYGHAEIEGSAMGFSVSGGGDAWGYGVGFQHYFDGKNGVRVDYTREEFDDDAADVWAVAYSRRF